MTNIHKHGFKELTPIDKAWEVLLPHIKLLPEENINTIKGLTKSNKDYYIITQRKKKLKFTQLYMVIFSPFSHLIEPRVLQ